MKPVDHVINAYEAGFVQLYRTHPRLARFGQNNGASITDEELTELPMKPVDHVINAYEAGFVQRYHTHPRLARFGQNNGHHSYGVAALVVALHPNPTAGLLKDCITHDQGERFTGDLPAPFKRDNMSHAAVHKSIEGRYVKTHFTNATSGQRRTKLGKSAGAWLKAMDMLECYLFASLTVPEVLGTVPWVDMRADIFARGDDLYPTPTVGLAEVMTKAKARTGFIEPIERAYK